MTERTPRKRKPLFKRILLAFLICSMGMNTGCLGGLLGGLLGGIGRVLGGVVRVVARGAGALVRGAGQFIANGGLQQVAGVMGQVSQGVQNSRPPQATPPRQPTQTAPPQKQVPSGKVAVGPTMYRDPATGDVFDLATGKKVGTWDDKTKSVDTRGAKKFVSPVGATVANDANPDAQGTAGTASEGMPSENQGA